MGTMKVIEFETVMPMARRSGGRECSCALRWPGFKPQVRP
jgi:hypothetical protein